MIRVADGKGGYDLEMKPIKDLEHRMDRVEMVLEEFRKTLHIWWADRNWPQADPDEDDAADAMLERANR